MSNIFKRWLGRITKRFIPAQIKRMIVLTSLTNGGEKPCDLDRDYQLDEFKEYFNLSSSKNSMRFAIEVGNFLWRDIKGRWEEVRNNQAMLAEEIYAHCPESLRYDTSEKMHKDIIAVLEYLRKYHPNAMAS